jgi:hypothetical protein
MSELWLCSPGRNRPAGALGAIDGSLGFMDFAGRSRRFTFPLPLRFYSGPGSRGRTNGSTATQARCNRSDSHHMKEFRAKLCS